MYKEVPHERVHRLFYPVIPVIITAEHGGTIGAMMASSCIPISLNPSMVGVAIMTTHTTHRLVKESGQFAVCWLSYDKLDKAVYVGETSGVGVQDKLKAAGLSHKPGRKLPVPIPDEAVAWLECKVAWSRVSGDHELFAADVVAAYAQEDFGEYWRFENYTPIFYVGKARPDTSRYVPFRF